MPPRSDAARTNAPGDQPMSNGCPQVQALDRQTSAIDQLTAELRAARLALTPAAEAITDLGSAQKKLCAFIVGNRLKILVSLIGALLALGVISPTAAEGLKEVLRTWGPL
jgi:hypothetical protein